MKFVPFTVLILLGMFDLSAQSWHVEGMRFDDKAYSRTPVHQSTFAHRLAPRASVKAYAPVPQDQGAYNNCVGWASAYAARTILMAQEFGHTDSAWKQDHAFSPAFTYKLISEDNSCGTAVSIEHALHSMKYKGAVHHYEFESDCTNQIPSEMMYRAKAHRIDSYERLYFLNDPGQRKVEQTKVALAEGFPVIIGMRCPPSFEYADGQSVWNPREPRYTRNYFGHAMCVVGYDEYKYGGAFQIMNSWGTGWGDDGFIWVRYKDFAAFVKYGYIPVMNTESELLSAR